MTMKAVRLGFALVPALVAPLLAVPIAQADATTRITTGSYVYDQPTNGGAASDLGKSGLISYARGALGDGATTTTAQWVGNGQLTYKDVSVVLDLYRDYPLGQLTVTSNAPNRYYGIRSISIRTRAEAEPDFTSVHAQSWYGTSTPLPEGVPLNHTTSVDLADRRARFVIIKITRGHEWQHMPLTEVTVTAGAGEPGADPALPLNADQLRAEIAKPVTQIPRPGMADVGNYHASTKPDDGAPDNAGGVTGFRYGQLFNRDAGSGAGWRGRADAPKNVTVVFDLLNDFPLDRIRIFSRAPNQFWGFDEINVTYRAEASATYRVASRASRARTELDYQLDIPVANATARFVRIEMVRQNQYLHLPLSEIEFVQGSGPVGANPGPPLPLAGLQQELTRYTRLADEYGQYLYQDWPGKVTSDEQLRQEYRDEAARLADVRRDTATYDRYGGVRALGDHGAAGFFRLEKVNGRWWFVTPDGHLFFLKGVDSVSDEEWGYGTVHRNADGSPRDVFDALPDPRLYPGAYATTERGHVVSFVKANLTRKYGQDYGDRWRDITTRRLLDWGFNALSKWAADPALEFPHIDQVTAPPDAIRVLWGIDPFDPEFRAKLDRHIDIKSKKNDPWLIGYFFDNERGWNRDVVAEVLRSPSSLPAKRAFASYLADAYGGDLNRVNAMLGTNAESFDALADLRLDVARLPAADLNGFITRASEVYYSTVRAAIRKQDPHHLFLGSALVPTWRTSLEWNVGGLDHLDAISLDVYGDNANYLTEYEPYDKPVVNLEYSFNTHDRGMRAINAAARSATVAERGTKYRSFVEAQATSPVFVGSGWFVYYDQAVTGRPGDGESFNFGLLNQQDQPYTEMTEVMASTNDTLELVHRYGSIDLTATAVAETITRLEPVRLGSTRLPMPQRSDRFVVSVAWSSRPDVIDLSGAVRHRPVPTVVRLVLRVTKVADGSVAVTEPLAVRVDGTRTDPS
ncbi:hypothetical protein [Micromonospora deserti]|uniref:F5/8 type C domain-containing protein n=1 Tax=Micromonospora deserti TaxID=2070366 RepID=A0A2W2D978_9ACTN|nr:hypothetical protein [Micromonospora deserti]PZG01925.1 hypothetical protein C1I99_04880 [Micromonospora deserti]